MIDVSVTTIGQERSSADNPANVASSSPDSLPIFGV